MFLMFITFLIALQFKHFVVDFPLQNYYKALQNFGVLTKHWWISMGIHGVLHALFTVIIVYLFFLLVFGKHFVFLALSLGAFDGAVHMLIDYFTIRTLNHRINNPNDDDPLEQKSDSLIKVFGNDQLLHQLTYILVAACVGTHIFF